MRNSQTKHFTHLVNVCDAITLQLMLLLIEDAVLTSNDEQNSSIAEDKHDQRQLKVVDIVKYPKRRSIVGVLPDGVSQTDSVDAVGCQKVIHDIHEDSREPGKGATSIRHPSLKVVLVPDGVDDLDIALGCNDGKVDRRRVETHPK